MENRKELTLFDNRIIDKGEFLSAREAASRLCISENTFWKFASENQLTRYPLGARLIRFKWSEIEELLNSRIN